MNREEFIRGYWNYYLSLEKRVLQTESYVEFHKKNERTFSNEYAMLIQAIGSELDSFFKQYCGFEHEDHKTIADYASYILDDYPNIKNQSITVIGTELKIIPFDKWEKAQAKKSLFWWISFDDIKHSRYMNKKDANQKNVLNLLGALYLLEMKYLQKITDDSNQPDIPNKQSELFSLDGWNTRYIPMNGGVASICL